MPTRLKQFALWFCLGLALYLPGREFMGFALAAASSAIVSKDKPVLMDADEMNYDQTNALVTASGNVEVVQGDTILMADHITYDQKTRRVRAHGAISVLEPGGNVLFADNVELQDDLKAGVIDNFRARLSDNSLFAAQEAEKLNESQTVLKKAVYSPCKICKDEAGDNEAPLWQLKAENVLVDQQKQRVTYHNAFFEVYGVPVAYTPYFSHATPGADNKTGLLIPQYGQDSNLGAYIKMPYYISIDPSKDITLIPVFTTDEGPVLAGQYRQKFDNGQMEWEGSVTNPDKRDALGNSIPGNELRGHIRGKGEFALTPIWELGFDVNRASDDTYLRKYDFGKEDTLTSRVYVEGIKDRNYASLQSLAFQGLRVDDDPSTTPFIAPLLDVELQTDPGWMGSRFGFTGNALSLTRETGAESHRASLTGAWMLPYVADNGQVIESKLSLRGDIYAVNDVTRLDGTRKDGTVGRVIPEVSVNWRYPFINRLEQSSLIVEPNVMVIASPKGGNSDAIPNEDSQVQEFSDLNLFSPHHFTGFDAIETGPRVNYGLRSQWQVDSGQNVTALIGQNYSLYDDERFPFTNNGTTHLSDYVGRVGWSYNPFEISYRFRLDRDNLSPRRNEIAGYYNQYPLGFNLNYILLDDDPSLRSKEEAAAAATLNLSDQWTFSTYGRRDLRESEMVGAGLGLTYANECVTVETLLNRSFIRDRDIEPSTSFNLRVSLKNIN